MLSWDDQFTQLNDLNVLFICYWSFFLITFVMIERCCFFVCWADFQYLHSFQCFSGLANIPEVESQPQNIDQEDEKWQQFVEGEVILKKGFVNKRKGLFARKRMLLLTTGPRMFYIDPVHMVKKGEIPWSSDLRVEAKNFKIFFVHTVSLVIANF